MITTTETVICIMPLRAAAAPKKAYVPGVIHGPSGSHAAKKADEGNDSCKCCTMMPTILPKEAPIAMDGTKMPAGTLHPNDMMTSNVRKTVAIAKEKIIRHRFLTLILISLISHDKSTTILTRTAHRNRGHPHIPRRESPCSRSCRSLRTYSGNK